VEKWALFVVISAIFFLISGATFSSLGVVLPSMIAEMSWSWSQAGAGFSLFALTVGLASTVPAWILRHLGIKATYGIGGLVMTLGFCLLALTHNFNQYLFAAALLASDLPPAQPYPRYSCSPAGCRSGAPRPSASS